MGLISFIKSAGEKVFGKSEETLEKEKSELISDHIKNFGFDTSTIQVVVDDEEVTLTGSIDNMENKNKIVVTAGNVDGISSVNDQIILTNPPSIDPPVPEKLFYTVKKGDYLSKIAKEVYGKANKYDIIFEANKPMLKDPNMIYPGQVLVIPPLD
jgi:nucleoid-associated protein YgaU